MGGGDRDIPCVIVSERLNKHDAGNQYPGRGNADSEPIDAQAAQTYTHEVQDSGAGVCLQLVERPHATRQWKSAEAWRLLAGEDRYTEEAELGSSQSSACPADQRH